jgi:DNA-binding transcriptional LysR family regulator
MHIGSLKLFCDVVRLHSFSRCAEENGVTQSAASQAVHSLEEHLGVSLIDRSQRPWELTSEGKIFYEGARDVVERYAELESQVKSLHEEVSSVVRVGSIYSAGLRHMNYFAQKFSELYPKATVHLDYLHPERVYEAAANEEVDLGIVSFPRAHRDIAVIPWKQEPMVLACHPGHKLAKIREVSPAQLNGEKFVAFERGLGIRSEVDRFLKKHEADVDVALEFDNIESIKRAVEIGSGVALLPRTTLDREVAEKTLAAVPLAGEFSRPLAIIHRRGRKFGANVKRFIELLQDERDTEVPEVPLALPAGK